MKITNSDFGKIILSEGITQLKVYAKYFESKSKSQFSERFNKFAELFQNSLEELNKKDSNSKQDQGYDQVQEMIENSLLQNYHSSITADKPLPESESGKTRRIFKATRPQSK